MSVQRRAVQANDLLSLCIPSDPQISPDASSVAFTVKTVYAKENRYLSNIHMVTASSNASPQRWVEGVSPRWSPDSRKLAYIGTADGDRMQVLLVSDTGEPECLTNLPNGTFRFLTWSPDGHSLAFSFRPNESSFTAAAIAVRKQQHQSSPPRVLTRLAYREEGAGYVDTAENYHLYLVQVASGETRKLTTANKDHGVFCFSPDSSLIAYTANVSSMPDLRPKAHGIFMMSLDREGENTSIPLQECPVGPKYSLEFSPDGSQLAFSGHTDDREGLFDARDVQLFVCDLKGVTRRLTDALDIHFLGAILNDLTGDGKAGPYWSSDARALYSLSSEQGTVTLNKVSTEIASSGSLHRVLGSETHSIHGMTISADRKTVAVLMQTPQDAGDIYLLSLKDEMPERLTYLNQTILDTLRIAPPNKTILNTSEGHTVSYCTYMAAPKAIPHIPMPAIVLIHGGPHLMHGVSLLSHEIQTLVAAGFCILTLDPRGSKGYGQEFSNSIVGIWDEPAINDIQICVDHAIAQGWIDPNRLGIMGGSYGGYLTASILTTTNRFRAAIAERGTYCLLSEADTCDVTWDDFTYFRANTSDTPDEYLRRSPLTQAAKIETPLLLLHGEGDMRCPIQQAEQMFAALRRMNKHVVFVRYGLEANHGLARSGPPDLRIDRLDRIICWFKQHLLQ